MTPPLRDPVDKTSAWSSWAALFASSGTLICCALPALLVAMGAGAALSTLVSAMPGLVWVSEYKEAVFAAAGLMLAFSGVLQWRNRSAPCPLDPALRQACMRMRQTSTRVYGVSVAIYFAGGWFAFVQPWLGNA
ncbi:hypothetical protein [Polaromonas sp. A23]|uniref:hypothetical protein n=1 Tax=Polaromonas sp. A23 TaxID=1944133 RepID=UPI000986AC78|nr:hypothetical protein [Polaromonas sp. A23]OOG46396.1 hypothetical protein B0B52_03315 [Polaromonas sp. A23]